MEKIDGDDSEICVSLLQICGRNLGECREGNDVWRGMAAATHPACPLSLVAERVGCLASLEPEKASEQRCK